MDDSESVQFHFGVALRVHRDCVACPYEVGVERLSAILEDRHNCRGLVTRSSSAWEIGSVATADGSGVVFGVSVDCKVVNSE